MYLLLSDAMGGLAWRCVRFGLASAAAAALVGALAGSVRLLPWLFAADVPFLVTLPFARALLAVACEVSLTVGLPLGFVLSAVLSVRRGEQRALAAQGVSPLRLAMSVWFAALLLPVLVALVAIGVDPGAGVPGRFATDLIRQGEQACRRGATARTSWIPMIDVTWLCFPDSDPLVTAPLPRSGGRVWFSAKSLSLSDDLSEVTLSDFKLGSRPDTSGRRLLLGVERARISKLRHWGQPVLAHPWQRLAGLVLSTVGLAVLLPWLVFRRCVGSRLVAGTIAVLMGIALFRCVQVIDRGDFPGVSYLLVPLGVVLAIIVLDHGLRLLDRRRWRRTAGA